MSCRIVNGNFSIPANDGKYECFHELLRGTLRVDPATRFKISDVLERLAAIGETKGYNLKAPLDLKLKVLEIASPVQNHPRPSLPERPPAPRSPVSQRAQPSRPPPPSGSSNGGKNSIMRFALLFLTKIFLSSRERWTQCRLRQLIFFDQRILRKHF